ncbi:DNA polymerase Y family protein [Pseudorhodoferax aquiterrae]
MQKPDGFTILTMDDLPRRVWPMAAAKINGIGPKANERLASFGIATIGDLAERNEPWLIENFGRSYGAWLYRVSHGLDDRPVVTYSEPVSMSRETTFERNLHAVRDREELGTAFKALCDQVAADLARKGYVSKKIGVKLRFDDFKTVTRDVTLPSAIGDARSLRKAASSCIKRIDMVRTIRLLGIKAGSLGRPAAVQEAEDPAQFELKFD